MTEPDENQDGLETSVVPETPSDQESSDEFALTEGMPGEEPSPDESETESAEPEKHEKTPEEVKDDRAHFQKKAQEETERRKATEAALAELTGTSAADDFFEEMRPATKPVTAQDVIAQRPADQGGRVQYDPNMTDEQLQERFQSDPVFQAQVQREMMAQDMQRLYEDNRARENFKSEVADADRVINKFCADQGIKPETLKDAQNTLRSMGIKGNPKAIAALTIQQLNHQMALGNITRATTEAVAKAVEAKKTQLATVQPVAGAQPLTVPGPGQKEADEIAPDTV